MIWAWLHQALIFLGKLVLPHDADIARKIDPNESCPACGHTNGSLRFMRVYGLRGDTDQTGMVLVVHTCGTCNCMWGDDPLSVPKYPVNSQLIINQ